MMFPSLTPDTLPPDSFAWGASQTTQLPFELPQGWVNETGKVSRHGQMRLATGADEWVAQQAAQVMANDAYGILMRLSRVIVLSDRPPLSPDDMGTLFMPDIHYLIDLYNDLNPPDYRLSLLGEFQAIPWHSSPRR